MATFSITSAPTDDIPTFLILEAKEDVEFIDTTPGWDSEDEWVPITIPAGMYRCQRALNPHNPDGMWVFVAGTRFGRRQDWLLDAENAGIKVSLLEARRADAGPVPQGPGLDN